MNSLEKRLRFWQDNLVDSGRRNSLLHFRAPYSSSLKVEAPDLSNVFDRLVNLEKPWRLFEPTEEVQAGIADVTKDGDEDQQFREQTRLTIEQCLSLRKDHEILVSPSPNRSVRRKNSPDATADGANPEEPIEVIQEPEVEVRRNLPWFAKPKKRTYRSHVATVARSLYRQSESEFEDRGVRILYLACGLLEWQDAHDMAKNEWSRAPIVMVPIQLSRPSFAEPFNLLLADEDVLLNPALELKMKNDYSIDLPQLPDWDEQPLEQYLQQIDNMVRRLSWRISREAWMGLFSFHKLVMYQDLQINSAFASEHPIIRALGGTQHLEPQAEHDVSPEQLDELIVPESSYLVRDADSSQLACIEAVKRGSHLVLQGPPGTGKSQTITNMISESLAAGKSVLFVSEKMAALEVVYERLAEAGLSHYCLELHSHKANKRKVVEQLKETYFEKIAPGARMNDEEYANLKRRRDELNNYVQALHVQRAPLKKSAYEVYGDLASLRHVPFIHLGETHADLDSERLDRIVNLGRKLGAVWSVPAADDHHTWHGCTVDLYSLESSGKVTALVKNASDALTDFLDVDSEIAGSVGYSYSRSLRDSEMLIDLLKVLRESPGVERVWLCAEELDPLADEAKTYSKMSNTWHNERGAILSRYNEPFLELPPDIQERLSAAVAGLSDGLSRPPALFDADFVSRRDQLNAFVNEFTQLLHSWQRDSEVVKNGLGLNFGSSISGLRSLMQIAHYCSAEFRPEKSWFNREILQQVEDMTVEMEQLYLRHADIKQRLLKKYDESVLSLDLDSMAKVFAENYLTVWKVFKPGFHKLRSTVRAHRRDGSNPPHLFEDLKAAKELVRLEKLINAGRDNAKSLLGSWYRGPQTNFMGMRVACEAAKRIIELTDRQPSEELKNSVSAGSAGRPEVKGAVDRLKASLQRYDQLLSSVETLLPIDRIPDSKLPLADSDFKDLVVWINRIEIHASEFAACCESVVGAQRIPVAMSLSQIEIDLRRLKNTRTMEKQVTSESERLQSSYGHRFAGIDTDWSGILQAITWTHKLREVTNGSILTDEIIEIAQRGGKAAPSESKVLAARERLISALKDLASIFSFPAEPVPGILSSRERTPLLTRELLHCAETDHFLSVLTEAGYQRVRETLNALQAKHEELRDWIDFKTIKREFGAAELGEYCDLLLSLKTLDPSFLSSVVRRSLLSAWLSKVTADEPALSQFRGHDHDTLIAEFRALDKKHKDLGYSRVIEQANKSRPQSIINQPGSEGALLLHEANKSRKHLPLRKLFAQVPNLLKSIKPCFLMSPLSVSQYLDPRNVQFDLVIFDEASQIRSEDAVCAIYRGKQLVVCGDNKQLPPSSFFEQTQQGDDDGYEDDDNAYSTFDSILDECSSIGIPSNTLRWHYRSKHESLIHFSNRQFYNGKLVTFPASRFDQPEAGVHFKYVPDGVYDRSGKQNNDREAEVVAQLVMDHYRDTPHRSLGVITFSVAQMNAVKDAIENLVKTKYRELEHFVQETKTDDKEERFFVKNLERIQGNERDVIIFSVGYGRDRQGKFTMNFGPMNKSGGERRLNVAVTRAREKTLIVSSIRASDFDISGTNATGVLNFYHYLNYAENGLKALESDSDPAARDFVSPLEADVASAVKELGYDCVSQVGCGGFGIDLGVVDPNEQGRYLLGIECDGPTYKASCTARDRDRLRKQILEGLGWRILRIWAPDWVTRRDAEVERLTKALELAREGKSLESINPRIADLSAVSESVIVHSMESQFEEQLVDLTPYTVAMIQTTIPPLIEIHQPEARPVLFKIISEIVRSEAPIHEELVIKRILAHWQIQRSGPKVNNALREAIAAFVQENSMVTDGGFLLHMQDMDFASDASIRVRCPVRGDDTTVRKVDHIHSSEIQEAIRQTIVKAMSLPQDSLVTLVARSFGFDRPSPPVKQLISANVDEMIVRGDLQQKNGRLQHSGTAMAPASSPASSYAQTSP
jgi:hypothetical protein